METQLPAASLILTLTGPGLWVRLMILHSFPLYFCFKAFINASVILLSMKKLTAEFEEFMKLKLSGSYHEGNLVWDDTGLTMLYNGGSQCSKGQVRSTKVCLIVTF